MKREIKFRAWDKKRKSMFVPDSFVFDENTGEIMSVWRKGTDGETIGGLDPRKGRLILMQSTGLHDKNGREIYEGDLFEHRFGYIVFDEPPHYEMGTECGVVVLEDGQFGVKIPGFGVYNLYGLLLREGHLDNMPKDDLFVMKIAGNIYENPELLEADHE